LIANELMIIREARLREMGWFKIDRFWVREHFRSTRVVPITLV
jgi:hypothetical protein